MTRPRPTRGGGQQGFSLVELLVAMSITLLLAGALAAVVQPARAAFERVPAELELQQRGRTVIDTLSQALRTSWFVPGEPGTFDELTVIVAVPGGARGVLSIDQPGPDGPLTLGTEQCPNLSDVCGFTPGAIALIENVEGFYDVMSIASTNSAARRITPAGALSQAYLGGSSVTAVDQFTFRLAEQPDGSHSLIRETAAGAIQPIVDFVGELSFEVTPQRVDVWISLEPSTAALRSLMSGRTFRTSIRLRNAL